MPNEHQKFLDRIAGILHGSRTEDLTETEKRGMIEMMLNEIPKGSNPRNTKSRFISCNPLSRSSLEMALNDGDLYDTLEEEALDHLESRHHDCNHSLKLGTALMYFSRDLKSGAYEEAQAYMKEGLEISDCLGFTLSDHKATLVFKDPYAQDIAAKLVKELAAEEYISLDCRDVPFEENHLVVHGSKDDLESLVTDLMRDGHIFEFEKVFGRELGIHKKPVPQVPSFIDGTSYMLNKSGKIKVQKKMDSEFSPS